MSVPEPSKILTPWAASGLKNTIPASANPVTGNAGYDQGFPAINMTPKEAGGIPPFGQDFNGILFAVTEALRYIQAGGTPTYSAALSTAIGGYPKGAILLGNDGVTTYRSLVDSNTNDPNSVLTGWAKNDSDRFGVSLASDGYQKLPSGLIIQWGTVTTSSSADVALTFPIAFPTACHARLCTGRNGVGSQAILSCVGAHSTTGMSIGAYASTTGARNAMVCDWMAIGY